MLTSITLKDGVTTTPVVEASSYTFSPDGVVVAGGAHLSDVNEPAYFERIQMTFKNRPSTLNAKSGLLSKEKRSISISKPHKLTADQTPGGVQFTTVRFEVESHPEAALSRQKLISLLQHLLAHTDAQDFITRGSLA